MGKFQSFKEFLQAQGVHIPLETFAINLLLTALLAWFLSRIYIRFGKSLSNRQAFAENFMPISITTMLIISVVKSSLALSLGMVGALSIVRFRAAIKEPEELAFLFITISIGLGFGAEQRMITMMAVFFMILLIIIKNIGKSPRGSQNLFLAIRSSSGREELLQKIEAILFRYAKYYRFQRFEERDGVIDLMFLIECEDMDKLRFIREEVQKIEKDSEISFINHTIT